MSVEIERKFLVHVDRLPPLPAPEHFQQGYLCVDPVVRVRLAVAPGGEERGELTVKGKGLLRRAEFNIPVPARDAEEMLGLCSRRLSKLRHRLGRWEIDRFPDLGLWLAEIELAAEDEPFERPAWLGEEVTADPAYSNARLATPAGT